MKPTIFTEPTIATIQSCKNEEWSKVEALRNKKMLHTAAVSEYLEGREDSELLEQKAPKINSEELELDRRQRRILAQLRGGKSPLLREYKHKISSAETPSPNCPLCMTELHNTQHIFECSEMPTNLTVKDLWEKPVEVASFLRSWEE